LTRPYRYTGSFTISTIKVTQRYQGPRSRRSLEHTARMQPSGTRLGIDYGAATTAAVLALADGRVMPVLLDGAAVIPSGVFVGPDDAPIVAGLQALHLTLDRPDCYLADPRAHLTGDQVEHVDIAGRHVDVLDVVAATLRHLVDEAARVAGGSIDHAAITVPAGWGPRRRNLLREAAARAGLTTTDLVADPVAAAAWLHATTPFADGACVLVCDAGASAVVVSVVQYDRDRWQVLATTAAAGSGGDALDEAIAVHAAATIAAEQPEAWERLRRPGTVEELRDHRLLWEAARQAKQTLWHAPSTVIAFPAPHPPVVLDGRQLAALAGSVLKEVPAALEEAVAAADVDRAGLAAAIVVGGGARLPGLSDAIAAQVGAPPTIPDRPEQVQAEGALHATGTRESRTGPPASRSGASPAARLRPRTVGAPVAFLAASLAVLVQALFGADIYRQGLRTEVVTNTAGFGVAALFAVLTGLAAAHMVATGATVVDAAGQDPPPGGWAGGLIAKAYAGGAALGVIVAAIYGLLAGAFFGLADNPYLRWSLTAALPPAVIAVAIALLASRLPADALRMRLDDMRQPVIPVLLAAIGVVTMWASLSVSPSLLPFGSLLGRLGAATTGIAIALTVTRLPLLRLVVGSVLAIGAALVFTLANYPLIEVAYITAVTWWWLVRFVRAGRAAIPYTLPVIRRWLGRPPPP
jgi:hypothetical protein